MQLFGKTRDTLWTLIAAPTIWAAHFLLSYVLAVFRCAPNAEVFKPIPGARITIGAITIIALVLVALICRRA